MRDRSLAMVLLLPSIPSASTQRAISARMAMCWGRARSQAPQSTHSLACLWPFLGLACWGIYVRHLTP